MKKTYYWDSVSNEIGKLFCLYFKKQMSICEVGCSGGHFLEFLYGRGYQQLTGIEIREAQYRKTAENFKNKGIIVNLINDNVLSITDRYDALFSTGLMQCLDEKNRLLFIEHLSQMADIAIYTVPKIKVMRNVGSKEEIAVAGCVEYPTGSIAYELSLFYSKVYYGKIDKHKTGLDDILLYFICEKDEKR